MLTGRSGLGTRVRECALSRPPVSGARGFTLIELLVVIVIIAVLAALGTSAWQRAQRQSRAVACMQNLRQIGAGLAKYIGDHDGTFPELAMARTDKAQNVPVIDTELRPYVSELRVFACPDDHKRLAQTTGTSYLWNVRLNGQRLANLSQGLVLLTGPMGSGKSTTLACLLEIANRSRKDYVVTIQDSIEFEFTKGTCLLRQQEVGRDGARQKQAIRSALRQAPDVLALGELREAEVLELALQAAHSGCVVFATLQTTSLLDTFYFLIDAFPQNRQSHIRGRLADCLKAVVGHTLLRRANGGRVAALETLFFNPAMAELLRADKLEQIPAAMKGSRYGQMNHNDALVQLILSRKVEPLEAYLRCQDRESFIAACKKADIDFDPRGAGQVTAH